LALAMFSDGFAPCLTRASAPGSTWAADVAQTHQRPISTPISRLFHHCYGTIRGERGLRPAIHYNSAERPNPWAIQCKVWLKIALTTLIPSFRFV